MRLRDLLAMYRQQRDIEAPTCAWLSVILGKFEFFLGRASTLDDLTDETVSKWVTHLLDSGAFARQTVYSYRRGLLILWRFAAENRLFDRLPVHVKRVRAPTPLPQALTAEEVVLFLAACPRLPGKHRSGISRALLGRALILTIWDSGLRLGDILRLAFSDYGPDGAGLLIQKKTGFPVRFSLSPGCLAAIDDISLPKRKLVFGEAAPESAVYDSLKRLSTIVGLTAGTRKLRKSGATAVEIVRPGAAMAYLGHRTPGLAHKHYVDPRLVQEHKEAPPPLIVIEDHSAAAED